MASPYNVAIELTMATNHPEVLGGLSRSLLAIHPRIRALEEHFGRLRLAIAGALGTVAGVEIFRVLEKITEKTAGLSHEWVQLQKTMGITNPADLAPIKELTFQATNKVKGVTQQQAAQVFGQAYSIFGQEEAEQMLVPLLKFGSVMRNAMGKFDQGDMKDIMKTLRAADIAGMLSDPETGKASMARVENFLGLVAKGVAGTHGMVTPSTMLAIAQQGGPALANLSDEGLIQMMLMSQQMGGHRAGTAMMSLFQQMGGGAMFKRTAEAMSEMGMLGPGAGKLEDGKIPPGFEWGTSGGRVVMTDAASKRLTGMLGNDPQDIAKNFKKLMDERGIGPEDQMRQIFRVFGRQTSQRFVADMVRNLMQQSGEKGRIGGALDIDKSLLTQNEGDIPQNLHNLETAWTNFLTTLAGPNAENVIMVLEKLTGALQTLTNFTHEHPDDMKTLGIGVAALGAAFLTAGVVAMLAAIGPAGWLIAGIVGLGTALAGLKASGALDTFDTELTKSIESRHQSIIKAVSGIGDWIYEGILSWMNKIRGLFGLSPLTGIGGVGPLGPPTIAPSGLTGSLSDNPANRKLLEDLSGATRGVAPPTGILGKPGAFQNLPSQTPTDGKPGTNWPGIDVPFIPMNFRPDDGRDRGLENAIRTSAQQSPGRGGGQTVQLSLNIDGRRIAEAISSALADLMTHPSQAPFHDTYGGYASTDSQIATT